MNIVVNTRLLLKDKLEGIGWFSYQTLKRITQQHPEHHFFFVFDRDFDKEFVFSANVTPIVAGLPTRHPFLWWLWFEVTIPKVLKKVNADLFISTDGYLSLKTNVPSVAVIHDLNFVHHPKYLPWLTSKYYNHFFRKFAKKATRLGTVSEYSKNDIVNTFGINPNKIDVCYNGINEAYASISEEEKIEVKQKYTSGNDFFVFVGALNPRKNVSGLLKAFELYRKSGGNNKLVIVGDAMHKTTDINNTLQQMQHKLDVIFVGRLSAKDLSSVMASATALTFVPFFEGFGIPLVEAMRSNTPIIASNTTSLPEIAGNAALYSNPNDYADIASNMKKLESDKDLRNQLISEGNIQEKKFSWDLSANRLWMCVEKAMEESKC